MSRPMVVITFEGDDALPFEFKQAGKGAGKKVPVRDETLYEM